MPKKILGIDIGSSSIKFVQLSKSFRGISTARFSEKPIPSLEVAKTTDPNLPKQEINLSQILKQAIEEKGLASDEYITCLPSKLAMIREVNFPFKDIAKIRQVIKFEIEQSLPFPPEEVIVDFLVNGKDPGSSMVTVFCIHKRNLSNHLSTLNAAGIEPKVITVDSFPILGALRSSIDNLEGIIAHLEIGANNTVINIFKDGNFAYNRTISKAGNFITAKLAEHLKISFQEAERLKKDPAIDLSSPNSSEIAQIILKALEEISAEIIYSIDSFQTKKCADPINKILLSGGTSSLKGITQVLRDKSNCEVSLFTPNPSFEILDIAEQQAINSPIFHLALGLASLEADDKLKRINLRREDYTFKVIDKKVKTNIKYAAGLVAAIILLSVFNLIFDLFQKRNENKVLENRIISIYREIVPSGNVVNAVVQAEQYMGKAKEDFRKFQQIIENKSTPLELMRELSRLIPKDSKVKILNFSLREKKLEIKGENENLESVDRLEKILRSSSLFKEIKISNIQMNQIQNIAEFTLDIDLN